MAFQPDPSTEDLYFPSTAEPAGVQLYSTAGLDEGPADLYSFSVGDYAYPVLAPIPHIELTVFNIDPATASATVYRTVGNRTMPVRGQINVYAVGGFNVIDWEAPFGIPVTYRAQQFNSDGDSLGFTPAFTTQLDVDQTWIQNPFNPLGGKQITFADDAASTVPRPADITTVWANGSGLATAISGQRHGVTDAPVSFFTKTEEDGDAVRAMLGDPYDTPSPVPVLVIRTGIKQKRMRFPQPFYAVVNIVETAVDGPQNGTVIRWAGTGSEVQPPAPALIPALLTLDDIDASYGTLADIDAAYDVLFSIDRDYSLAGTS